MVQLALEPRLCHSNVLIESVTVKVTSVAVSPSYFALSSWSNIIKRRKMRRKMRRRVVQSVLWSSSVCMEDVVLHYQPGSAAGLSSLLERTEKLLESFSRRTPPVFTPWFPTAADSHLPIRPAKPAPVITSWGDLLVSDSGPHAHTAQNELQKPEVDGLFAERPHDRPRAETTRTPTENLQKPKDGVCVSETPNHLLPSSLFNKPDRAITRLSPEKHKDKDDIPVTDSPVKRSWSVFAHKGVLLQSSQSMSKQFHHMVSIHRLHLRQRARWVISQHNCGATRDIEQVRRLFM